MENTPPANIELMKVKHEILAHSLAATWPREFSSRRGALQMELAVGLVLFAQETTNPTGKAALKSVYHAAGYECMAKVDRDYKTVNRRLNTMAKLFDILGLDKINGWLRDKDSIETKISQVVTGLATYCFVTFEDVRDFIGTESNRTRVKDQSADTPSLEDIKAQLLAQFSDDLLFRFAAELLKAAVARRELTMSAGLTH